MGIAEDFYGLKGQWSRFSRTTKVVFILSFALTILSVGSIADSVFRFKGFIVYGIEFYHSLLEPVGLFLSRVLWFEIDKHDLELCVLVGICIRVALINDSEIVKRSGLGQLIPAFGYLFVLWSFAFILDLIMEYTIAILISYPLATFALGFLENKNNRVTPMMLVKVGYFLIVYLVVACIAAISEGLARPLPG